MLSSGNYFVVTLREMDCGKRLNRLLFTGWARPDASGRWVEREEL